MTLEKAQKGIEGKLNIREGAKKENTIESSNAFLINIHKLTLSQNKFSSGISVLIRKYQMSSLLIS